MDWDQILLRKVINVPLPYHSHINKVDTTVVIGKGCESPMVCKTPFILETPAEQLLSQNLFPNDCNFLVSYTAARKNPSLVNKNCILELNGNTIDPQLLKKLSPGAFFINLSQIYSTLLQYDQTRSGIKKTIKLPVCQDQNNEIDLSKLFDMEHSPEEWVFSLRKLRPDIPFGIRVPANFIERDVIFALICEANFIILDCVDSTINETHAVRPLISSLPAVSRTRKILYKLNNHDITLILGMPDLPVSKYLKLFALGGGMIVLNNTHDVLDDIEDEEKQVQKALKESYCLAVNDKSERICQLKNIALQQLRLNILECGYNRLSDIGKANLLTTSFAIKEITEIASVFDADNVCLPWFNLKKKVKDKTDNKT